MHMGRISVYLPDELAKAARAADLNISELTQHAVRQALRHDEWTDFLRRVRELPPTGIDHATVIATLDEVRNEPWPDPG